MGRREQAEWRRERLLDAALDVFVEKGVDGATVKDIARAAGVTPGLLYHYFESKDALVVALMRERGFLAELRRLLAAAADRPAETVLPELVRNYRRVLAENAGLVSLFFSASSTNRHVRTAMQRFVAEGQRLLTDYLEARVAAGELRVHNTRLFAQTLLVAVAASQLMGSDTDPDQLVHLFLNGAAAGQEKS
ncbi:MAG: TetR family transcriptional regulator [Streptosporangiales bacterium]|nr:TetR family transcriptional regulator [Streptosporangiales bacterium]